MDLALSEDQRLIAAAAADFLAEACDSAAMRRAAASEDGFDRALWQCITEQGWCGVQAPPEEDGLGLGWVGLALLQEQLGRRLACVPFFDSVVLSAALLRGLADAGRPQLAEVERGTEVVACALEAGAARALPDGSGWRLEGTWAQVGSAAWADTLLLAATDPAGATVLLAVSSGSPALRIEPLRSIDTTRRSARVQAQGIVLPAGACLGRGDTLDEALRRARDLAAIGLAAEQLGTAQQCLELSTAYTVQRLQFGQPVARFQAVKHRCAQMLVAIESARSAVYGAAAVADLEPDAATLAFHAAQARCEATEAAQFCAQEAIQLHGGVGYTWEYDPQLYFKRAQADSQRLQPLSWWRERVAAQLLERAP
ncbi:acyl-CoA dehydrogenase family protein [Azohydromonas caseinilytica]|uniref:Acyl-CoA dehydrogenase n=1 Tax=Azohydromonas caseinilytica TaxID=2728836 RepID=A0A848FBM6_9BURK|nr:acyl-CoA dehydrogenase family protein [Azohydromonas caseinilytica]NML16722.1 acyl-CoA dehydrogenase [Azohydromonas caseinilytica]